MSQLSLIEIKVKNVSFVNDVDIPETSGSINVQIGTKITSMLNYNADCSKCRCETTVELVPNPQVNFGAKIVVTGIFECADIQDRKELHIEACKKLFPHVQVTTSSFMNMMGFPNFVVEEPVIDVVNIIDESKD